MTVDVVIAGVNDVGVDDVIADVFVVVDCDGDVVFVIDVAYVVDDDDVYPTSDDGHYYLVSSSVDSN